MLFLKTATNSFVFEAVATPFAAAAAAGVLTLFGVSFMPMFLLLTATMFAMDVVKSVRDGVYAIIEERKAA